MNSSLNASRDSSLLNLLNTAQNSNISEIEINEQFQIFKYEMIKNNYYTLTLSDNKYGFSGFLLNNPKNIEDFKKGKKITIKKIKIKSIGSKLFIIINDYEINSEDSKDIPEIKLLKQKDGNFLDDKENIILNFSEKDQSITKITSQEKKQNKEHDIDAPMDSDAYTSLRQLTTFSRDFVILIRVTKKSEIKTFQSKNGNSSQGKLFYFIVLDMDDNEMQCTCFNKACDKFYDLIEEDQIYEIRGGMIKYTDKKFSYVKSDYRIILDEHCTITKKKDTGLIKKNNMKIIKIKDIQNMPLYSIIDICVVVLDISEPVLKHTKNGDQLLKKIIVADTSNYKIEVNLWRIHSNTNVKFGDILLISNVKVGEYRRRILTTFDETCIKVNPPKTNEYVKELEEFIEKTDLKGEFTDLQNNIESKTEKGMEDSSSYNTVHIKDVLEYLDYNEEIHNFIKITGFVFSFNHSERNFYMGCADKNCKKKLVYDENNEEYTCPGCHKTFKEPTYYYTLSIKVGDDSCCYNIDIFGKTAEIIMKCTAKEYRDILLNDDIEKKSEIENRILLKEFNFWVKPKIHSYNSVDKKKIYAYKIKPVDEKVEAHQLIDFLKKEVSINH